MSNVEAALNLVTNGMTIGLGSGAASERFLHGLAERIKTGLHVRGVPTSLGIETLARNLGVPLVELADAMPLDLAFDGADEVDAHLNMIKGYGKALVREKIVAAAAKRFIILIGPERVAEKRVAMLGQRGKLPIEVVPFAVPLVLARLREMGHAAEILCEHGVPVTSDNGNRIVHASVTAIADPLAFDTQLQRIPGVVDTGLFVGMAHQVFVQTGDTVEILTRAK
jgi:ribose 5-phosphate isomerase A